MPAGTCALCLEVRDLRDSHLIPRAFYKLVRDAEAKHPNPIVVNPAITVATSKQVSDHLLCGLDWFQNQNGPNTMLGATVFRLRPS